jgi:hypothetical protein
MNEDIAALLPSGMQTPFTGFLDDYLATDELTAALKEEINHGALIVHYAGHGSTQIWAHENLFDTTDVAALTNADMLPFIVSMSCLTGHFVYPESWNFPSLAEAFLRAETTGAAAALMPSGMTTTEGQYILNTALFEALFTEDIRTLGPAISSAKETLLAHSTDYEEVSETFLLFGDPAMTLKIPLPRRPTGLSAQCTSQGIILSWSAAADCNGNPVSGYILYRATTSGGPYTKLSDSLITGTSYTDTTAEEGTTCYYVVTAVDSDGDESVTSAEVSIAAGSTDASTSPDTQDGAEASSGTGGSGVTGSGDSCFIDTAGGE